MEWTRTCRRRATAVAGCDEIRAVGVAHHNAGFEEGINLASLASPIIYIRESERSQDQNETGKLANGKIGQWRLSKMTFVIPNIGIPKYRNTECRGSDQDRYSASHARMLVGRGTSLNSVFLTQALRCMDTATQYIPASDIRSR